MSQLSPLSPYRIRAAEPQHVAPLPAIERAAAALFDAADLPPALAQETTPESDFAAAQREGRLWVALNAAEEPVGFALARILDGVAHLEELDVSPDHGRRGLGAKLAARVIEWGRRQGLRAVTLSTFAHLPWNGPFYERLGFRPLAAHELSPALRGLLRHEAEIGFDPAKRVAMRLELSSPSGTGG
ncbi:MAG: GNAT family N-acetyltransferase [Proteobacteria bacterium]|nr:GNAT family N-acetyltransferase [Pseudomonadota bacterium]